MKTIIIYASKYGCAENCAKLLKEKLNGEVVLKEIKKVNQNELGQYDNVIIGGSIYIGKIQKDISDFCLKNIKILTTKKIGLYICSLMEDDETNLELSNAYPKQLQDIALIKSNFGGQINYLKLNIFDKLIVNMISKSRDVRLVKLDENKNVCNINYFKIEHFINKMNQ